MKRIAIALFAFTLSGFMVVTAKQNAPTVTDAVQDQKILSLEEAQRTTTIIVQDIRDKQNYTLGGIAIVGLLIGHGILVARRNK